MGNSSEDKIKLYSNDHKVELVLTQPGQDDDEISLGQLVQKIIDGKKTIMLCTLIALLITLVGFGGYNFIMQDEVGSVSTVLSFNFKGIKEGLNPNEEEFNINELTNKKVLEDTVSQLGLASKGIDSETLRKNILIQGIIPEDIINQMTLINQMAEKDVSQLEKLNEMEYFPTQYKVDLHISKDMDLSGEEAEQILTSIVSNYKTYFMDKYNDRKVFSSAITSSDLDRYDYSEYIMIVDDQLEEARVYLEEKQVEAPEFRSKTTGVGFEDLISQIDFVRNVDINNVQSIIDTFVVSKNKDRLSTIYRNKIQNLTIEMDQYRQEADSLRAAANEYKKDSMVVLGEDGLDTAMEFTLESKAYDKLIEDAINAEKMVAEYRYDIQRYEALLNRLVGQGEAEVNIDITPYIADVEEDIGNITEKVEDLVNNMNTTLDDYYTREVFKGSVKMDVPAMYSSNSMAYIKKFTMALAISVVLGMMIGVMGALSKGILQEEGQGGPNEE
ncbi:MAG: hypothetical protein GX366_05555 [Epulopiscium sp.]|nr:hypothetical protein [Candidatus Epulonipiscium sp.]